MDALSEDFAQDKILIVLYSIHIVSGWSFSINCHSKYIGPLDGNQRLIERDNNIVCEVSSTI